MITVTAPELDTPPAEQHPHHGRATHACIRRSPQEVRGWE